ncbi:hypothetical protein DY000_02024025 [Brassica cretica]|uniref:Uncharacterized protein n=1 Tax=Brassica cretica TaxID=69181 RepID=A0ABQ7EKJ5_BRACR|nr:hypothetical protein DY000_02024025 [Brassica cretica]
MDKEERGRCPSVSKRQHVQRCKEGASWTMYLAIFVNKVHGSLKRTNQEPALGLTSLNQPITSQHSLLQSDQFTQIANKKTPS